jgi:hypothetical protein
LGERKGKVSFEKKNHFPGLMFGLNLIWANLWFDLSYGVKTFDTNEK